MDAVLQILSAIDFASVDGLEETLATSHNC